MPLVKSFCHTSSAQMEKSQRGRGKWVIILFRVFLFSNWYFYGTKSGKVTTVHEIFAGVGSGMLTLKANRPLDMDEPCLAGKVIIAIHSRVTLMYNHLLFQSFSVFNIQHFNGWMQGAILLKNMH